MEGGSKAARVSGRVNLGKSVDDLHQLAGYLRVTRPTPGSGNWGSSQSCTFPSIDGFLTGLERERQIALFFSQLIEGGEASMFEYNLGENALINCADTPPGIYELEVAALDGRGGKGYSI